MTGEIRKAPKEVQAKGTKEVVALMPKNGICFQEASVLSRTFGYCRSASHSFNLIIFD